MENSWQGTLNFATDILYAMVCTIEHVAMHVHTISTVKCVSILYSMLAFVNKIIYVYSIKQSKYIHIHFLG